MNFSSCWKLESLFSSAFAVLSSYILLAPYIRQVVRNAGRYIGGQGRTNNFVSMLLMAVAVGF